MAGRFAAAILSAMGLFRKVTSVSTLGAVDYRSAKDKTAAYTKRSKKEAKKQTDLQRQMLAQMQHQPPPPPAAAGAWMPAGWYRDPQGAPYQRWWDGRQWTGATAPPPR